jgi:nucleoid DNA-binding protein
MSENQITIPGDRLSDEMIESTKRTKKNVLVGIDFLGNFIVILNPENAKSAIDIFEKKIEREITKSDTIKVIGFDDLLKVRDFSVFE